MNTDTRKQKKDKVLYDKKRLVRIVINNNYSEFPNNPYEPSNLDSIKDDLLTKNKLTVYLHDNYDIGERANYQIDTIKSIIEFPELYDAIQLDEGELFKILTHFGILSQIKRGWYNLLIAGENKTTTPSLSDYPSYSPAKEKKEPKKLNDAIIRCYYSRLINGLSNDDRTRYPYLLPNKYPLTALDELISLFDEAIQKLFFELHRNTDGYLDEAKLPDTGLDEVIAYIRDTLIKFIDFYVKNNTISITESLRVLLIKMASFNLAINQVDAILRTQDQILSSFPNNFQYCHHIISEDEIIPTLENLRAVKSRKLPSDLIKCAQVICRIYIISSNSHCKTEEELAAFENRHMQPDCVAVAAALLYNDFDKKTKLNLYISGDNNPGCLIYKEMSGFSRRINVAGHVTKEDVLGAALNQELIKFFVTRHSIAVNSLSDHYTSQEGAVAHLRVRREKLEIQKEMYQLFKMLSVEDTCSLIVNFCAQVDDFVKAG